MRRKSLWDGLFDKQKPLIFDLDGREKPKPIPSVQARNWRPLVGFIAHGQVPDLDERTAEILKTVLRDDHRRGQLG